MQNSLSRFPNNTRAAVVLLCTVLSPFICSATQDIKPPPTTKERGIELYRQQKTQEAIATLRTVVAADKEDQEAWYYLGLSLIRDKDFKGASKSLETAIKISPQFANAHSALAYALLQRNKTSEAAREAQIAIDLDGTIADAYYILGVTRLRAGATSEATENADKAIKLRPEFASSYLLKAQSLVGDAEDLVEPWGAEKRARRKERYSKAVEALEKYLQLSPKAPNKEFLGQQLEALKAYVREPAKGTDDEVFTSRNVTTRARVLSKPEPAYTSVARQNGVRGTVILRAVFAADGTVKYLIVVRGLPDGLTEVCIEAAKRIKFVPATVDGRPVAMWMQLEYNFMIG